jgi:hypothetical protein
MKRRVPHQRSRPKNPDTLPDPHVGQCRQSAGLTGFHIQDLEIRRDGYRPADFVYPLLGKILAAEALFGNHLAFGLRDMI